jgi:hypothetical protein
MFNILVLLFGLLASPAFAQNTTCANKPAADNSNACANTRYVTTAFTNAYPLMWLKSAQGTGVNATGATFGPTGQSLYLSGTYTGAGYAPYALLSVTDTGSETTYDRPAFWVVHNVGTSAGEGSRTAAKFQLNIDNPLPCTVTSRCFHIAAFPQIRVGANLGGDSGTYRGDTYGGGCYNQLKSGATYVNSAGGCEFNVSVATGASVKYKYITSHISVDSDAVAGTTFNAMSAFLADSSSTYKWPMVFSIGRPDGAWPLNSSSVVLGSTAPASGTRDVGVVIECTGFVITTACIRGTGFSINGSGAASVASLASTGAVSGTTGNFSSTLSASTITSTGAAAGFVAAPRSGSGNNYQWYNPSGTGIRLTDGGSDLVTIDSVGAISTASNVTNLHNYTTVSVPTASACGGSPAVDAGSSNHAGKITFGSATTACTLTFASAFANNAFCTVTPGAQPAAVANIPYISAQSKTAFTISGGTASAVYYYNCGGN